MEKGIANQCRQSIYLKASVVQNRSMRRVTQTGCTPRLGNSTWNWTGLKKSLGSACRRATRKMDGSGWGLAVSTQCRLLAVTRSVVYDQKKRPQKEVDEFETILLQELDEEYTRHPFYGTRRMTEYLCGCGYAGSNRKRVQRLMQKLGFTGMAPGPDTSKRHPQHKLYPYLLRGVRYYQPEWVAGVPTSPIFVWCMALSTWSRSSTGIAGRYCHGGYRTPWMQGSV